MMFMKIHFCAVYNLSIYLSEGSPRDVVANVLDCDIIVNEFELQSHYHVHIRTNTLGKGMKSVIPPAEKLDSIAVVLRGWLWY